MDPLALLRTCNLNGKLDKVVLKDDRVEFEGKHKFPKKTLTSFKSRRGKSYELDAVVLFLKHKDLSKAEQLKAASKYGSSFISALDVKVLLDYLEGRTSTIGAAPGKAIQNTDIIQVPLEVPVAVTDVKKFDPFDVPKDPEKLLSSIRAIEKNLQDHNSMLLCAVQGFGEYIPYAKEVMNDIQKEMHRAEKKIMQRSALPSTTQVRFAEVDRSQFNKSRLGEADLGIDEYGGHSGAKTAENMNTAEIPEVIPAEPQRRPSVERSKRKDRPRSSDKEYRSTKHYRHKKERKYKELEEEKVDAIILIPMGFGSILNSYNSKLFLSEGEFRTWEEIKKGNGKPEDMSTFRRIFLREGKPVTYQITEKVPTQSQWERVVAVLVTGKDWQFKDYPHDDVRKKDKTYVDLFTDICGFYLHYSKDPIPKNVQNWNVRTIAIDKNNRHKDRTAFREFWTCLDKFMQKKKNFKFRY